MNASERPILCVGALTLDTIFRLDQLPTAPGKVIPLDAVVVAEGMAAAQAASIVRLGGAAALWASAGDDPTGDRLVTEIAEAGVDTALVRRIAGARSGFSSILMDRAGGTIIVPQYDAALASAPQTLPTFAHFAAVMCDVRWPAAAELALSGARAAGIPAILDADVAPAATLAGLTDLASHVVASEMAARTLTGCDEPAAAAAALAAHAGAFVAVTAGERGVFWVAEGKVHHTPGVAVAALDTLAAGDVFHAAFALGLVEGWPMAEIMAFAARAAAIKCTHFGGRLGCPTRAEVLAFKA